jgi:hypothetical protein
MSSWFDVGRSLLGSWPNQVSGWGEDAIEAYCKELAARGLEPGDALRAIRSCGEGAVPTASSLAKLARTDPLLPSGDELIQLLVGEGGVLRLPAERAAERRRRSAACERRCDNGLLYDEATNTSYDCECRRGLAPATDEDMLERARDLHPRLAPFVERQGGPSRLRRLGLDDPENEHREARRHELRQAWVEFCADVDQRAAAALASGQRRGQLVDFDPLAALQSAPVERANLTERTTQPQEVSQ